MNLLRRQSNSAKRRAEQNKTMDRGIAVSRWTKFLECIDTEPERSGSYRTTTLKQHVFGGGTICALFFGETMGFLYK